jgi:hypothetical protein
MDPITIKFHLSRDVVFHENASYSPSPKSSIYEAPGILSNEEDDIPSVS